MTRNWLAAYTKARHETAVARQLEAKEVPFLLPTYLKHNPRFVMAICRQIAGMGSSNDEMKMGA